MQTERRVAANPQTKPVDLGCESTENWQIPSTSTVAIVIITQPVGWYSFYRPTNGGRLSWPNHCCKGAQPMPKAVYRSGCRDKHNCQRRDSNLDPLTPQSDALTTRLLRPVLLSSSNRNFLLSTNCIQVEPNWVTYIHTYTHLTALFSGLTVSAGTRKVKPIWILLKQETVSGSGISWPICKFAQLS